MTTCHIPEDKIEEIGTHRISVASFRDCKYSALYSFEFLEDEDEKMHLEEQTENYQLSRELPTEGCISCDGNS